MLKNNSPIGFFDSGLGGISIWKEVNALLPEEATIYLADSLNAPYGQKPKEQIIEFSIKNTELLINMGCKLIVVACNTATTNAIQLLRKNYDIPFVGIEPAIKPAALITKTGKIGVLATRGTLNSELFYKNSVKLGETLELIETEGTGLVQLIEEGKIEETKGLLEQYLIPMLEKGVDNIVLGCSHYSFLIPIIKEIVPKGIIIIDSGEAVAKQVNNVLQEYNLLKKGAHASHYFYTNSDTVLLNNFLKNAQVNNAEVAFKIF